jgi:FkbM family methyltransferase
MSGCPLCYIGWDGYHALLEVRRPRVAFDLGAHNGSYIGTMLDWGVEQVHAFEPVTDMCQQIRDKYCDDNRVVINQLGISNHPEVLKAVLPTFAWALLPEGAGSVAIDYVNKPRFDVQCTTVDEYVAKTGAVPDYLKVDVDGYECHVLEGGRNLFTTKRPWMLFELSGLMKYVGRTVEQMCNLIYDYGYQAVSLDLTFACPDVATLLELFPYHSSYDVFLLPIEE